MGFGPVVITNAGRQAINTVLTVGGTLNFVKITGGSGFPSGADVPAQFTGLKTPVMDAAPTSANNAVLYQSTYKANYSSANAPYTFQLNEQAVWYSLNGAAPFLFGYLTTGSASGDTISPSDPGSAVVKDYIVPVVYATNVPVGTTVTLTPSVDLHAPRHQSTGVDPIPNSTSTVNGLCPKTPGDSTKVLLGSTSAAFGTLPPHAPTHLDNGTDVIPTATVSRTGLLPKLSGDASTVLQGTGQWGAGRLPGEVVDYAGAVPPTGWLMCDGQAYSRATYAALFAVIGTMYGAGDGSTTFNLPDCRGRTSVGAGQGAGLTNRALSVKGGEENHTLSAAEMPLHSHTVNDSGHIHGIVDGGHAHSVYDPSHAHSIADPGHIHTFYTVYYTGGGGQFAPGAAYVEGAGRQTNAAATGIGIYSAGTGVGIYASGTGISIASHGTGITLANAGGGAPHATMPPFIAFNRIIRT